MTKRILTALILTLVLVVGCLAPMTLAQDAPVTPAEAATDVATDAQEPAAEPAAETVPADAEAPAEEPAADAQSKVSLADWSTISGDQVLITLNGEEITKADVEPMYNQMQQQYAMYGMDFTVAENQQGLLNYVFNVVLQQTMLLQKSVELNLDQYTEEELTQILDTAQSTYDSTLAMYKQYYTAEGKTDEEIEAEVLSYLEESGYTVDALAQSAQTTSTLNRVIAYIIQDVSVTDEQVEAAYNLLIEEQKAGYENEETKTKNMLEFINNMTSDTPVYYTPEGCRTVKHILVTFDRAEELKTLYAELDALAADDAARAEKQTQIDELLVDIQPKLDEIQARIDAGDDFDALIAEYGEDGGMQSGTTAETGYYMNAVTQTYVPEFTAAGMALEAVGDVSEPVLSSYGFHIIRYNSELPSGATPLADVQETFKATLVEEANQAAFSSALTDWSNTSTFESNIA